MQFDEGVSEEALKRLRRIEGQIGGIIRMIEEGRECRDVIHQMAAASKAMDRVGFKLIANQLQFCVEHEDAARREGYDPDAMEKLFMTLA